jgi:hypothetical protein
LQNDIILAAFVPDHLGVHEFILCVADDRGALFPPQSLAIGVRCDENANSNIAGLDGNDTRGFPIPSRAGNETSNT